jgi:cyanophycinase
MSGMLALVGGEEFSPGNEEQDRRLCRAAAGGPAYVVPTAAARMGPDKIVAAAIDWFSKLGLQVQPLRVLKRSDAESLTLATSAAAGGFFYLVGGDPGLVTSVLRGTAVWAAICDAWQRGAALAGSSAGAMAMAEWTLVRARYPGDRMRRSSGDAQPRPGPCQVDG